MANGRLSPAHGRAPRDAQRQEEQRGRGRPAQHHRPPSAPCRGLGMTPPPRGTERPDRRLRRGITAARGATPHARRPRLLLTPRPPPLGANQRTRVAEGAGLRANPPPVSLPPRLSPSLPVSRPRRSTERLGACGARLLLAAAALHLTAIFGLVQVEVSAVIRCLGEAHGGRAVAVTDEQLALVVGTWRERWAVRAPRGALPRVAPSRHEAPAADRPLLPSEVLCRRTAAVWHSCAVLPNEPTALVCTPEER